MNIVSKTEAKLLGLKQYFTGIPCWKGHTSERYTSSGACIGCQQDPVAKEKDKLRARANYANPITRAKHLESMRLRALAPEEKERKWLYNQQEQSKQRQHLYDKKYRQRQDVRERQANYLRQWCENNPGKMEAYELKRKLKKAIATPAWADINGIVEFYKARPPGYHVDHIIPLQGKLVSGLNVLNNWLYGITCVIHGLGVSSKNGLTC